MEDSKKTAEFAKMNRWLTTWIEKLRVNETKKQAAVRAMTQKWSSQGRKYWKVSFKKDDDRFYSWFLDHFKSTITPWLTGSGNEDGAFILRFTTKSLGRGNIGSYYPIGPCQAMLYLQEDIWEAESDTSNESSLIHELGHHYSHLVSCLSIKGSDLLAGKGRYASGSPEQRKIVNLIFSDHIVLEKIVARVNVAKENFKKEDLIGGANFADSPDNTVSYNLWDCKGVAESLAHAADPEERSRYFDEWLQGSPMTDQLLLKLKRGREQLLNFNWSNSTCEETIRMKQETDKVTINNGVSFRFGGLIYLNDELNNLVGAINDLVKHNQTTEQYIEPVQKPDEYASDAGSSFAYIINNLIKLANTLDLGGSTKEANRIDSLIKKAGIKVESGAEFLEAGRGEQYGSLPTPIAFYCTDWLASGDGTLEGNNLEHIRNETDSLMEEAILRYQPGYPEGDKIIAIMENKINKKRKWTLKPEADYHLYYYVFEKLMRSEFPHYVVNDPELDWIAKVKVSSVKREFLSPPEEEWDSRCLGFYINLGTWIDWSDASSYGPTLYHEVEHIVTAAIKQVYGIDRIRTQRNKLRRMMPDPEGHEPAMEDISTGQVRKEWDEKISEQHNELMVLRDWSVRNGFGTRQRPFDEDLIALICDNYTCIDESLWSEWLQLQRDGATVELGPDDDRYNHRLIMCDEKFNIMKMKFDEYINVGSGMNNEMLYRLNASCSTDLNQLLEDLNTLALAPTEEQPMFS